jgi:hypothetical protein
MAKRRWIKKHLKRLQKLFVALLWIFSRVVVPSMAFLASGRELGWW